MDGVLTRTFDSVRQRPKRSHDNNGSTAMTKEHDKTRRKPRRSKRVTDDKHLFGVERIDATPEEIARAMVRPRRTNTSPRLAQ